jgi:hypothetical protein
LVPKRGFYFDRPLVMLQSDDWGRVGVRDRSGVELLQAAGINLGEKPYDLYSMETASDVAALHELLASHRDHSGRSACMQMNFMTSNVDFARSSHDAYKTVELKPLHEGLPGQWRRPGLMEAYRLGIHEGAFHPGLHGQTHFCASAVRSYLTQNNERGELLRTLWKAETPYIYWRIPWIGYEYWDAELPTKERFLSRTRQAGLIRDAVRTFKITFGEKPLTAAAPGYRSNQDTHRGWVESGVLVAQHGPNSVRAPYVDNHGLLHVFRSLDFEPAVDPHFSLEKTLETARTCIGRGLPLVISLHAINFQSSLRDFRTLTLDHLHRFLAALESEYSSLSYIHDVDLWQIVNYGKYDHPAGSVKVEARLKRYPGPDLENKRIA